MKRYIAPEIDCVFFDITTPTNARTLDDWIAIDEASQEGFLAGLSTATTAVEDPNWASKEWTLTD